MDKKVKAKWVKALRSGRYKQAVGTLKKGEAHCCLGVLLRIQRGNFKDLNSLKTTTLPAAFAGGLSEGQCDVLGAHNDGAYSCVTHQQYRKHSFPEIADYIEKNL